MSWDYDGCHLETDGDWHANLMCRLAAELTDKELKTLKQVIMTGGRVHERNSIAESEDFYRLWDVLVKENLLRVGDYKFLITNFEMLRWMKLIDIIRLHSEKIEDSRLTKVDRVVALSKSMVFLVGVSMKKIIYMAAGLCLKKRLTPC